MKMTSAPYHVFLPRNKTELRATLVIRAVGSFQKAAKECRVDPSLISHLVHRRRHPAPVERRILRRVTRLFGPKVAALWES